jgi:hypothetical protein
VAAILQHCSARLSCSSRRAPAADVDDCSERHSFGSNLQCVVGTAQVMQPLPAIGLNLLSHLTHNTSHLTHNTSHLTHNTSHLTHNTQHLTHNTQHLTPHTSHSLLSPLSRWCAPVTCTRPPTSPPCSQPRVCTWPAMLMDTRTQYCCRCSRAGRAWTRRRPQRCSEVT